MAPWHGFVRYAIAVMTEHLLSCHLRARWADQHVPAGFNTNRHSRKPGDIAGFALLIRGFGVRVLVAHS
jgi:hypothetical protein